MPLPSPPTPNEYPIELTPPDISSYASGNSGIPYAWTFAAETPGPHVLVTAVVHGNEPCGAIALDWLLREGFRPLRGTLTLLFVNVSAYGLFDPADPNASRWVDEDFNRLWSDDVLDGDRDSCELSRAREIRPLVAAADRLLDIHSMQNVAPPLMMCGWAEKGRRLARDVGVPERIVADHGHAAGKRMRDYRGFADPDAAQIALLVECGQHWEASAADLARAVAARFLTSTGLAAPDFAGRAPWPPVPQQQYEVTEAVTIEADSFRFAGPFRGGELLAEGDPIGWDGDREIRAPYDRCMLVMPSKRLWRGQTAVRLARRIG